MRADDQKQSARPEKTGKTPSGGRFKQYLAARRQTIAAMSRQQRIRLRLFQALVTASVLIVGIWLALSQWIKTPELPSPPPPSHSTAVNPVPAGEEPAFDGALIPGIEFSGRKEGVYTFLVVGRDTASGLTDTMILVTYDTLNQTINGMSLMRDTIVNVSWSNKKLNTVYNYYKGNDKATQVEKGITALKSHVGKLTGIEPDFYVIVEWKAVGELVDALGGIWFEVPYKMDYDDPVQDLHIHQEAGYRLLTGEDAMQVIRHRQNNDGKRWGDDGRVQVQQDFLMAVAKECLQVKTLLKAPALASIFVENTTTDLTLGNLLAFAQLAYGMDTEDVNLQTMPYVGFGFRGVSYVLPAKDDLLELVNARLNPYLRDVSADDLEIIYSKGNGAIGVSKGSLADASAGNPPAKKPETPAPEETDQQEGDTSLPADPADGIFPDPNDFLDGAQPQPEAEDPAPSAPPPGIGLD